MFCFFNKTFFFTTFFFFLLILSLSFQSSSAAGPRDKDAASVLGSLLDKGNQTNIVLLAKERTRRKDPLDGFNYYTGGWDALNRHYLASVVYSGFTPFLVAILWFFGFGFFLLLLCCCFCCCCCCRRKSYGYSKITYMLSLILLSMFTIAAIVGTCVLYTGEMNFRASQKDTLDYLLLQVHLTAGNLTNFSHYLIAAKAIKMGDLSFSEDMKNAIGNASTLIIDTSGTLETVTYKNKNYIHLIFDKLGLILIIPATIMLVLVVLGFLLSVMGLQCLVHTLMIIGWVLVTITLIVCGLFLVVHNALGDTCVAMNEWVDNPNANTTLSEIIPCVGRTTAQEALNQSKEVTFNMAQLVNTMIATISNRKTSHDDPLVPLVFYNQSGPLVPYLCNPYNNDRTDRICVAGEVDLNNATQVWRSYECQSTDGICNTEGRITSDMYDTMNNAVSLSYGLHNFGPYFVNLADCTFVRDIFSNIHDNYCPGLRKYTQQVYIGLAMVSVGVMFSLILWVFYARERRHKKHTKRVDATSGAGFSHLRP